ncbi:MAG: ribonuclease III [Clostridia bacterium]|nr:ribonuclease III [Clostridia bacterium]
MTEKEIKEIEKIIGYEFKDKTLLKRAFTHSSVSSVNTENYQSLEYLGDAILDFVVAERLMEIHPDADEGELTVLRSEIVSKEPLAKVIGDHKLNIYLDVKKGEDVKSIRSGKKVMSDIFEAVTAAIYYDSKNLDEVKKFVLSKLASTFNELNVTDKNENYKSLLKEYCDKHKLDQPDYPPVSESGPDHNKIFTVACLIGGDKFGEGSGHSKKEAEQHAAEAAYNRIFNK